MQRYIRKITGFIAIAALVGTMAFILACGGEDPVELEPDSTSTTVPQPQATATPEPAPEPSPTATPRSTRIPQPSPTPLPEPTPIPEPTPSPDPTPTPGPPSGLAGLTLHAETLGRQVIEGLSQEEAACIEGSMSELLYRFFLDAPFSELITGARSEPAREFFGCLTPENVVHLGSAMEEFQAGGYTPQEKSCLVDIYLEHPDFMYRSLGMEPPADLVTAGGDESLVAMEIADCRNTSG